MPRERDIDFRIRAETSGFLRPIRDAQTATESLERGIRCLLYTSPSPRDRQKSRMPSSA